MAKVLLIILDGVADRALPELNGKTPLEAADTPTFDELAKEGINGIFYAIAPGIPPGSDTGHLAILGYDPIKVYTGRGVFEAAGVGIELKPGDVAFRGNLATVDENLTVLDRRAGRITEGTHELAAALSSIKLESAPDVEVIVKEATEHRVAVVFRGPSLSHRVSDTDPHNVGAKILECQPLEDSPQAQRTAQIVNEFMKRSHEILSSHPVNIQRAKEGKPPANIVLLRGPSIAMTIPSIEQRFGVKSAAIAAVALVRGVCKIAGMTTVEVPGADGSIHSKIENKGAAAVELLKTYDLVLIHIKGPDEASHDGDLEGKIKIIERADRMISKMLDKIDAELYLAITGDHATPLRVGDHTGDLVPLLIHGPGIIPDEVDEFCERAAMKGGLGQVRGLDLLPILLNYAGKMKKFGA